MSEAISEGLLKGLLYAGGMAAAVPFVAWATRPDFVRFPARRAMIFRKAKWFAAPAIALYVLFMFGPIPPVDGPFGDVGVFMFCVFVVMPAVLSVAMSCYSISWTAQSLERRALLLPPKIVPWDEMTYVGIQPGYDMRFRAHRKMIKVDFKYPGGRQLVRYARCRLKNNTRVAWGV